MDATVSKLVLLLFGAPLTVGALRWWAYKPQEARPPADDEFLVKWAAVILGLLLLSLALAVIWPWWASLEIWKVDCRQAPAGCPL